MQPEYFTDTELIDKFDTRHWDRGWKATNLASYMLLVRNGSYLNVWMVKMLEHIQRNQSHNSLNLDV